MYKKIKGTVDIYGSEIKLWQYLETVIASVCNSFNYQELRTPIFETTNLFTKTIGESADIVNKEMYTFLDKGNRSLTLRPEGTASVMRFVVENKLLLAGNLPLKLFYYGPMFRYERPQKGRQRQFYQFGIENIGINSYKADLEVIVLGYTFLSKLGLTKTKILLNNIGTSADREKYVVELKKYLNNHITNLSEISQIRLAKNPLRILDSKEIADQEIIKNAPIIKDFINDDSQKKFDKICHALEQHGIKYEIDYHLVRGLDYYSETVFEIISTEDNAGAQNTLIGGGHYTYLDDKNQVIEATGFALGVERLILAIQNNVKAYDKIKAAITETIDIFIVNVDCDFVIVSLLATMLRNFGIKVEYDYSGKSASKQFKKLSKLNAKYSLIIGQKDFDLKQVSIKENSSKTESKVKINDLLDFFQNKSLI